MTLLLSWLGYDSRKISSLYIASDSRISWGKTQKWDFGRKVYAFKNSPDILGYCGDVVFPTQVLSQIIELGDSGLLFNNQASCKDKFEAIKNKFFHSLLQYPKNLLSGNYVAILHASRDEKNNFSCRKIEWYKGCWQFEEAKFGEYSDKLVVLGSGKSEFIEKYKKYEISENRKTSRAVFHCLCDTLTNIKDLYCGGSPQLVGLYNIGNGRNYGVIHENKRYFLGTEVPKIKHFEDVEWRNELFERCSGNTMKILQNAKKQPNVVKNM